MGRKPVWPPLFYLIYKIETIIDYPYFSLSIHLFYYNKNKIETINSSYKICIYSIQSSATINMSTASSLFIGYARSNCTTEQVKNVFNNVLDDDIVTNVDERVKTDDKGYEFKMFFVHFSHTNHRLENMVQRIAKESFVPIIYKTEYDKKLGERVERYWKVLPFNPKPKPIEMSGIRIMTEEETARIARPKHLADLKKVVAPSAELEEGEVSP